MTAVGADLEELRKRRRRTWLGLMSGTSCDGIDVAAVTLEESGDEARVVDVVGKVVPFSPARSAELKRSLAGSPSAEEACRWDARLGEWFAEAAYAWLAEHPADAIALSGHTFAHLPGEVPVSTLQVGNPAIVARRTGLPVVAAFRAGDVARGGEGAPLVPVGDRVLFGRPDDNVAVLNLGGISNLTWLPRAGGAPRAADCGPCNLVLDHALSVLSGGESRWDEGGQRAALGRSHPELVAAWMQHSYFSGSVRSTGREVFGEAWVRSHEAELQQLGLCDALATLVEWIARAVAARLTSLGQGQPIGGLLVGGGGAYNDALMNALGRCIPASVEKLDRARHRVGVDLREAAAFAILGNETLMGRPGSFAETTGCREPGPIGGWWFP
ncbi:MAG: anhydro-N-acetylmuramic acid kinase [Planctomycetota bacterium]